MTPTVHGIIHARENQLRMGLASPQNQQWDTWYPTRFATRRYGICAGWLQKWLHCKIGEKNQTAKSRKVLALDPRRGAGVAEQGCLLSSYPGKTGIGGSNPPLSARIFPSHCRQRRSFFVYCPGYGGGYDFGGLTNSPLVLAHLASL